LLICIDKLDKINKKIKATGLRTFSLERRDHQPQPQNGHVRGYSQEPCWQCLSKSQRRCSFVHNVSWNLCSPLVRLGSQYIKDIYLKSASNQELFWVTSHKHYFVLMIFFFKSDSYYVNKHKIASLNHWMPKSLILWFVTNGSDSQFSQKIYWEI